MFVVPWLMLVGLALSIIVSRSDIPNGIIPLALALMLLPLIGFLLITAVAIVTESERWSILTMAALNISYSFVWLAVTAAPALTRDATSVVPVWNDAILWTLGAELGVIFTIVASTFLFSRKRDFL